MPKLYIIPDPIPNAFATGRDYENSAVAVTEGLLQLLDEDEVAGVIAHELSHIKHYDMLIGTVAATIAGAISMLSNFGSIFSSLNSSREDRPNPIVSMVLIFVMPVAATIIQMTISRAREYEADRGAALLTGHPEWLQSALSKLENYARQGVISNAEPATAHMFIVNPFSGIGDMIGTLFKTHPDTEDRIRRLEELKYEMMR